MAPLKPEERLIVALDFDTGRSALEMVDRLLDNVRIFKVGSELFTACGPKIVGEIQKRGCKVFLDLKFHDIPNTAAKSAAAAARLGVFMMNVHASGGEEMMKRCAEAVKVEAHKMGVSAPKLIAVTVLTSLDKKALKKIGVDVNIQAHVLALSHLAARAGLDGVVSSPMEIGPVRKKLGGGFLIVTPGVRPEWAASNDQKRFATPAEAVRKGATYVVVGRPITGVENPPVACQRIIEEIKGACGRS